MRRLSLLLATASLMMSVAAVAADQPAGFWATPTITGYGKIHYLPNAAYKPVADQTYRIVFSLTEAAKSPRDVNASLDRVARTVNLYVAAGVPLDHLKFVAVASGGATPLVLNDAQYRAAYGVPNPNLPLIEKLRSAGVDVAVCGQAVAEHQFDYAWVDPHVTLALSALTTVTTLEHQGYDLLQL
ncbi:DsrE family protein [Dyella psychrodurans]|uniref:Sulfur reduction protein DsrE n=1 Tax=Dyella psychrodurans TaxID=1927960 RepID=A0A370X7B6_9GAMM|nr:DsrE family protein [Dyella psychrodurans]RDS84256.1 sulfur reduction protein DsrE [Dyella psychrodurans]